jgi:hypothetical protein
MKKVIGEIIVKVFYKFIRESNWYKHSLKYAYMSGKGLIPK